MKTNAKARSLHITPHPPLSRRQLKALPALFKDKYLEVYRQPVKTRAPLETTLNKIQSHQPHPRLWARLNKVLGVDFDPNKPISIFTIAQTNGFGDAVWALQTIDGADAALRLFAADVAECVLPLFQEECPHDKAVAKAIQTARRMAVAPIPSDQWDAVCKAAYQASWFTSSKAAEKAAIAACETLCQTAAVAAQEALDNAYEAVCRASEGPLGKALDAAFLSLLARYHNES
ncbi:MAG: hypothetical protein KatS3mg071_1603 [Meiothermus sp.]|nr:MAG: hypothetical protein KatS3mg071_1603 [Meiothermus sp.]